MGAYDLSSYHPGAVSNGGTAFRVVTPRAVEIEFASGWARHAPLAEATYQIQVDDTPVAGSSVVVRTNGDVDVTLPAGGLFLAAGQRLTVVSQTADAGRDVTITFRGNESETPSTTVYDQNFFNKAADDGTIALYESVRPFETAHVYTNGLTSRTLVVVTVTRGGTVVDEAYAVLGPDRPDASLSEPVDAQIGDLVEVTAFGDGVDSTTVAYTLSGITGDLGRTSSGVTAFDSASHTLATLGAVTGTVTTVTAIPTRKHTLASVGKVVGTTQGTTALVARRHTITTVGAVGGTMSGTTSMPDGRHTLTTAGSVVQTLSGTTLPPARRHVITSLGAYEALPFAANHTVQTASINGPAARMNNSACSNGTEVFVWGGDTGAATSFTDDIYAWNKTLDTWRTLTTTTANGWRNRGMFYDKTTDRVYILTMENTDKMRGYSAVNGASQFTSTVPTNANQGYGTAMGFDRVNRKVYLTEGFGTRAWVYSFAGGTWTALPNRPTTSGYSVPTVHKGKVYLLVRDNATQADFRLHVYDPVANSWSTITANVPAALKGLPIGSGADHAYGNNGAGRLVFWINTGGAYIYEPETNQWETLTYTPTRYVGGLAGDDNGVYLGMGGATSDNNEVSTVRPIRIPRREVLTVAAGETLTLAGGGKHAYHTLRVDGTLVVDSTNGLPVEIFCKKFEVGATGLVDGIGRGHQGSNANGAGPGGPVQRLNEGGTGASHAGLGGRAPDGYDAPPAVYGNGTDESVTIGSSGAAGSNTGTFGGASGEGGDGGAGLAVFASETITIQGTVNVSGADGQNGDVSIGGRAGGGGSGGTVLLRGSDVTISGSVRADGGAGGIRVGDADSTNDSGGGGGGGYVKIFHTGTLTTTGGTITAAGGFGPVPPDVPGGQTTSGAVGGTFTGPAISTHNVAVVTEDTAHGAATNNMTTLAALPRYKASLISEANADALVDPRGFDVVLMPRGYRGTPRPHTDARTRWVELGVPAVISPTDAGGTAPYSSSPATGVRVASLSDSDIDTVGHKSISITNNTHDITSGLALGALQVQDTNNFWYAGSSAGTYVGTRLADATTITGTNITPADHGIIAVEEGTNGLGGRPLPARVVIFGPVYQGQTTLNSAGRDLLKRCIDWAGRIPPPVDPNATTSFAGATSRTAPDENTPGARATT